MFNDSFGTIYSTMPSPYIPVNKRELPPYPVNVLPSVMQNVIKALNDDT